MVKILPRRKNKNYVRPTSKKKPPAFNLPCENTKQPKIKIKKVAFLYFHLIILIRYHLLSLSFLVNNKKKVSNDLGNGMRKFELFILILPFS